MEVYEAYMLSRWIAETQMGNWVASVLIFYAVFGIELFTWFALNSFKHMKHYAQNKEYSWNLSLWMKLSGYAAIKLQEEAAALILYVSSPVILATALYLVICFWFIFTPIIILFIGLTILRNANKNKTGEEN